MAFGDFLLDFFFGPCLGSSAVDPRQSQPRPKPQRQPSRTEQQQEQRQRDVSDRNGHQRKSARQTSRQLIAIIEDEEQRNKGGRRSGRSSSVRHSTSDAHQPRGDKSRASNGRSATSSSAGKRRRRRDDASCIAASLKETYRGTLDNGDFLEEQSVIRRSLKDAQKEEKETVKDDNNTQQQQARPNGHDKQQKSSSGSSQRSGKTKLENFIESKGKPKSQPKRQSRDPAGAPNEWDNVTTISMASKNPYRVLGISKSACPQEIYSSYKQRIKEEQLGGSERAFTDVGNAYRRIRADIQRQEARKAQRQMERKEERGSGKKKKKARKQLQPPSSDDEEAVAISRRNSIDARLKDHRELVTNLFAKDNAPKRKKRRDDGSVSCTGQVTTLQNSIQAQSKAMSELNIMPVEAGASNVNERQETIQNSCFYLSLAASYLSGVGAFAEDPTEQHYLSSLKKANGSQTTATLDTEIATLQNNEKQMTMNLALQLKRAIEAAVLLVHPDWAQSGMVGEEVQAFSDFLVYALDSDSVLGHWTIAVFDEASGFVDIYRGRHYGKVYPATKVKMRTRRVSNGKERSASRVKYKYKDCDEAARRANTLTLRYLPGHYQPLLPELTKMANEQRQGVESGQHQRPSLEDVLSTLEKWNVLHVVTDGRA
ncbi:hypothetical protein ACHAXT_000294 [Thalassiosira profunda]